MPLFDSDFLKKLEYLSLVSRRVFRGQLLAQRRTMQLGGGIEFADHREYTPGDDFRYLDWNVYARHDELLLKRFQEEEDLHVYLLLDCSRSMAFGDPPKFDYARQVAAALALHRAGRSGPRRGGRLRRRHRGRFPADARQGPHPVAAQVPRRARAAGDRDRPGPGGAGASSTAASAGGWPSCSATCSIPNGFEHGLDLLRHHRYEPHVIQIFDRREAEPELKGDVELFDVETGTIRKVTVTERNLRQYRKIFADFLESVARYCNTYGIGGTRSTTEVPVRRAAPADDARGGSGRMNLVNPAALFLAGLAVPIVVFYILKIRLRRDPGLDAALLAADLRGEEAAVALAAAAASALAALATGVPGVPGLRPGRPDLPLAAGPGAAAGAGGRQLGEHECQRRRAEPARGGQGRGPAVDRRPAAGR